MISKWPVLYALVSSLSGACSSCVFPDFLQNSDSTADFWHYHTRPALGFDDHVWINGSVMTADQYQWNKIEKTWTMDCVHHDRETDIYTVEGNWSKNHTEYQCAKFVKRTDNVVSVSYSNGSQTPVNCSTEELQFHPWLMVASQRRGLTGPTGTPCPITGAYRFGASHFDGNDLEKLCETYPAPSVLTSDCLSGDGMTLNFPKDGRTCIPPGWDKENQLVCQETWSEGDFHFSLLGYKNDVDQQLDRVARVPISTGTYFEMIIYHDIIMATEEPHLEEMTYLKLNATALGDVSVCVDELPGCDEERCGYNLYSRVCRLTCNKCMNSTLVEHCTFPESFIGPWKQITDHYDSDVTINSDVMSVEHFGSFVCSRNYTSELYVGRSDFKNGCLPKETCVNIIGKSAPMLSYRIGKSFSAGEASPKYMCQEDKFEDDAEPIGDLFRSKKYKTIVDVQAVRNTSISCGIDGVYNLTDVRWFTHTTCNGTMDRPAAKSDVLNVNLQCENANIELEYSCVTQLGPAVSASSGTKAILISSLKDVQGAPNITCWMFQYEQEKVTSVYMLMSPQCDQDTIGDVTSGAREAALQAKAELLELFVTTTSSVTREATSTGQWTAGSSSTSMMESTTIGTPGVAKHGSGAGRVVGIVFGCLIGIVLLCCVIFLGWRFYTSRRQPYRIL